MSYRFDEDYEYEWQKDNDYGFSIMNMTIDDVRYDKDVYYNVIKIG